MTLEEYNFSNTFWCDDDWDITQKIPKLTDNIYKFEYLNDKEMLEFINMKIKLEKNNINLVKKLKIVRKRYV